MKPHFNVVGSIDLDNLGKKKSEPKREESQPAVEESVEKQSEKKEVLPIEEKIQSEPPTTEPKEHDADLKKEKEPVTPPEVVETPAATTTAEVNASQAEATPPPVTETVVEHELPVEAPVEKQSSKPADKMKEAEPESPPP